ncbi:SbcC/MukB-like Walker B domain-containing protein [Thalassospira xiamenensis]|uniref:Uncharacterized protein YPO0396 n=1 Tax=Thalassospira xiamenensis TaxID=220697 RepID=A0A285TGW9_9PROT|nr:SbcC/MukB-like Walker B domain-containing protein [Thalassospira xiamenensis]SOC21474.1 Uncharacterized protein YPO0396 [Thalassospira xiamenensis]
MIRIKKLILVNWHSFGLKTIPLEGNVAILGENQAGKSTIMDGLQVLLSGGNSKYYRLNKASDATRSTSDRTVADYCLGRTSPNKVMRESARTYLVAVFEDDLGRRPPVSIGLFYDVSKGHERTITPDARFVCPGLALDERIFVETSDTSQKMVKDWDEVRTQISAMCAEKGTSLGSYREKADDFIANYMHLVGTPGDNIEPARMLRALIRGIAFSNMNSADDFVRNFLLSENHVSISGVRSSIQTYRKMADTAKMLEDRLIALGAMEPDLKEFVEHEQDIECLRYLSKRFEMMDVIVPLRKHRLASIKAATELERIEDEISQIKAEISIIEDNLKDVNDQIEPQNERLRAKNLRDQREHLAQQKAHLVTEISNFADYVEAAARILDNENARDLENFPVVRDTLASLKETLGGTIRYNWPEDPVAVDALLKNLKENAAPVLNYLEVCRDEHNKDKGNAKDELKDLEERIRNAENNVVSLPAQVADLRNLLQSEGLNPQILFELVDLKEDKTEWRNSVEGMLGPDRYAFFVEPHNVEQAIKCMRAERKRFPRTRIARTDKLQEKSSDIEPGTLASVLQCENDVVVAFVNMRLGKIRLAEDQEALKQPGRAIMTDGTYDDGIVVQNKYTDEVVLGRGAAALSLVKLKQMEGPLRAREKRESVQQLRYDGLIRRLRKVSLDVDVAFSLTDKVNKLSDFGARIAAIDEQLERSANEVAPELREKKRLLELQLTEFKEDYAATLSKQGGMIKVLEAATDALKGPDGLPVWTKENGLRGWHKEVWAGYRKTVATAVTAKTKVQGRHTLRHHSKGDGRHDALERLDEIKGVVAKSLRKTRDQYDQGLTLQGEIKDRVFGAVRRYVSRFQLTKPFDDQASISRVVVNWHTDEVRRIRDDELINYKEQAEEAADEAQRLFLNHTFEELRGRFSLMDLEIESVNKGLDKHTLTREKYSVVKDTRADFEPVVSLLRAGSVSALELDETSLFYGEISASNPHKEGLERLRDLLLDEDMDVQAFEDYRNYFVFDLEMKNVETGERVRQSVRLANGSGGELQAPFYVTIGIGLASIFHGVRRASLDDPHRGFGLAMFDEAFSNLDANNAVEVCDFLSGIGLQVIAAAPGDRRNTMSEVMNSIVTVTKVKNTSHVTQAVIKPLARKALREINPRYLSPEQLEANFENDQRAKETDVLVD